MTKQTDASTFYANAFKAWPKQAGAKPTAAMLQTIHGLGLRPGKQALANAMYLREGGATNGQVILALEAGFKSGGPQLNRMRDLVSKGLVRMVEAPVAEGAVKVYRIALTKKGEAKAGKTTAAKADKPAKAEKPAKAADKPAETPAAAPQAAAEAPAAQ